METHGNPGYPGLVSTVGNSGGCPLPCHSLPRYGSPLVPELTGKDSYKGDVFHSSEYKNGKKYEGRLGGDGGHFSLC